MTPGIHHLNWHVVPGSSNIKRFAHNMMDLHIEFKKPDGSSNGTWKYVGVSPQQFEAMKAAPSKGGHFRRHIRGKFNTEKTYLD